MTPLLMEPVSSVCLFRFEYMVTHLWLIGLRARIEIMNSINGKDSKELKFGPIVDKLKTRDLYAILTQTIRERSKYMELLPLILRRNILHLDVPLSILLDMSFRQWINQQLMIKPDAALHACWHTIDEVKRERRDIDVEERVKIWNDWFATARRTQCPLCIGSEGSEGSTIYHPQERPATFHLGHIIPFAAPHYGPCEQWNLLPICASCNSSGNQHMLTFVADK
jgi:hypothetical protein